MANGKPFDKNQLTCASWNYPLGTKLTVTHGEKSVQVTVTDRGPNKRLKGRIIDLSQAAFQELADPKLGLISVRISNEVLPPAKSRNSSNTSKGSSPKKRTN